MFPFTTTLLIPRSDALEDSSPGCLRMWSHWSGDIGLLSSGELDWAATEEKVPLVPTLSPILGIAHLRGPQDPTQSLATSGMSCDSGCYSCVYRSFRTPVLSNVSLFRNSF